MVSKTTVLITLFVFFSTAADETVVPVISARDSKGTLVNSKTLLEKGPVIVWFWNSCCGLKKRQLKALKDLYNTYNKSGLEIIAINVDESKKAAQANNIIAIHKIPFIIIMDPGSEILRRFHLYTIPYILVIAQNGKSCYSKAGSMAGDNEVLHKTVDSLFISKK